MHANLIEILLALVIVYNYLKGKYACKNVLILHVVE